MNENRQISAELQHNFHFLPHFNWKNYWTDFHQLFARYRAISGANNAHICKVTVYLFQNTRAKSEDSQFWRLETSPKINWLP